MRREERIARRSASAKKASDQGSEPRTLESLLDPFFVKIYLFLTISVGDWTSGSSSHPRKCSLTLLQGSNKKRVSVPEADEGSLRSTGLKTKTFGKRRKQATARKQKV